VDEAPLEAIGDLRTETVHVVVVAVDAHDARAVHRRIENFRRLQVGGNEDAGVEPLLRGLRGDGIGEITCGGAADGGEMKTARSGESRGHNAILEREGREANGVIFEIEILQAPFRGELTRNDQRRAANGVWA